MYVLSYKYKEDNVDFLFSFNSNGSWRSVWSIEFKDEMQVLELKGKLQVLFVLYLVHDGYATCMYIFAIYITKCLIPSIKA